MAKVDYTQVHYYVASEEGIQLVQKAKERLMKEVRNCLASDDAKVKRSGLVSLGASTGLDIVLRSEHPGPTGVQLFVDLRQALRGHNPSKEEVDAMLAKIYGALVPVWKKTAEENRQRQLKEKRATEARTRRPLR